MVTRRDLHQCVRLLADADGYPAGTVGVMVECLEDAAVIEVERPGANPDIITAGLTDVALAQGASAA